jgi:hypothetical protein
MPEGSSSVRATCEEALLRGLLLGCSMALSSNIKKYRVSTLCLKSMGPLPAGVAMSGLGMPLHASAEGGTLAAMSGALSISRFYLGNAFVYVHAAISNHKKCSVGCILMVRRFAWSYITLFDMEAAACLTRKRAQKRISTQYLYRCS